MSLQLGLVRVFKDHGVNMLAGDDSGSAAAWCLPGFGLHREFDLLAEAGLQSLEVLQTATLNAAHFLGRESSMGSVEVGKEANLVLLDADPTQSVQNLHRVVGVVCNGKYLSSDDLEDLKKEVTGRVANAPGPNPGATTR